MKRNLLFCLLAILTFTGLHAQVTQINSNKNLAFEYPISNTKAIFVSKTDQTVWVTDGTAAGTIQLSSTIKFVDNLGSISYLDGKLFFSGNETATGTELYVTDGTPGGTFRLMDINPGLPGSLPDDETAGLNGFLYFTAERPAEGRELWRTDGTPGGTSFVKDIVTGPTGSNAPGAYHLFSSGSYLLFAARTPASGIELWRSNGTDAGTLLLTDINTGNGGADASNPGNFYLLNNTVLFSATSANHGTEIWRTDGTAGNTFELADINTGTANSTTIDLGPGVSLDVFSTFHTFNNRAYFNANNGTSAGTIWGTDGTVANTSMLKDVVPNPFPSLIFLVNAVNLPGKFIFGVSDQFGRSELWQSDGTTAGTNVFTSFDNGQPPLLFPAYNASGNSVSQSLFQGKFFFMASTVAEGSELWISDGMDATPAHTYRVKDINPGNANGLSTSNLSYVYTSAGLYFPAITTSNGVELWKSDGTPGGTDLVADIIGGPTGTKTKVAPLVINNRVVFEADNGDNAETDLYAVNGIFSPLPVSLRDFTVQPHAGDAVLMWHTQQELNTKHFTVARSFDGSAFQSIGTIAAAGTSTSTHAYSFTDKGVMNSGKNIAYYRLIVTDRDGKTTQSPVITLRLKNSGNWTVRILSNPVVNDLKILLGGVDQPLQLSILDMSGRKYLTHATGVVNGQVSVAVSQLPAGSYVLVAETNKEKKIARFVK